MPPQGLVGYTHVIWPAYCSGDGVLLGTDLHRHRLPQRWPSIIAVVMNYIKQRRDAGHGFESHFAEIRTFWFAPVGGDRRAGGGLWSACRCHTDCRVALRVGAHRIVRGWLRARLGKGPCPQPA